MWMTILSFLGGPVIKGLIAAYQAKLKASNIDNKIAADLAATEIAAQAAEAQTQIQLKISEIGHPWEPEKIAFYVTLVFYSKCVVWDTVLGFGTTPPLKGDVSVWAGLVMSFYFGKRTFENVARIIKR
jgi:NAD(P)H-hydrate repair Nnr-like enzyme with NAD(P)H-hydrate epimerase domain